MISATFINPRLWISITIEKISVISPPNSILTRPKPKSIIHRKVPNSKLVDIVSGTGIPGRGVNCDFVVWQKLKKKKARNSGDKSSEWTSGCSGRSLDYGRRIEVGRKDTLNSPFADERIPSTATSIFVCVCMVTWSTPAIYCTRIQYPSWLALAEG